MATRVQAGGLVDEGVSSFLEEIVPRLTSADTALHNGDARERIAMWARRGPVTLLGAAFTATAWDDIQRVFETLGQKFSDCRSFEIEVLAAEVSGDLGYIVAIERTTAAIDGNEPTSYALRVSTICRRENGTWKVVHRHGDAYDSGAADIGPRLRADPRP